MATKSGSPLSPDGGGVTRTATTAWERMATKSGSPLSPDGGGVTRTAPPLGSGWLQSAERLYSVDHPFIFTINGNGNVCFLFEFGYFCLRADVRQC